MENKWRKLILLLAGGMAFSILSTGIMYHFFPQYLCYAVYDVSEGSLYQSEDVKAAPGTRLTECFVPRCSYLMGISIGVRREENENVVIGRLLDAQGKVISENRFALSDIDYVFTFHRWVKPGQQYQLEVVFPEENQSEVMTIFGPEDSGAEEHLVSYLGENLTDHVLYVQYIYGTYSRKLLAFWFIVLFVGGFMIGETVLCRFACSNSSTAWKRGVR